MADPPAVSNEVRLGTKLHKSWKVSAEVQLSCCAGWSQPGADNDPLASLPLWDPRESLAISQIRFNDTSGFSEISLRCKPCTL